MQSYTDLIKALRLCQFGECGCGKCYYKELKGDWCTEDNHPEFFDCDDKLKLDAAAAIEALDRLLDQNTQRCEALRKQLREAHESYERHLNDLEAEVKRLELDNEDYEHEHRRLKGEIEALQAQLPKRGEIVRCRECRWGIMCVTGQHLGLDGFCSNGKREVQE